MTELPNRRSIAAKQRAAKLLANDPEAFKKLGTLGGKAPHTTRPFKDRKLASSAGRKGGRFKKGS